MDQIFIAQVEKFSPELLADFERLMPQLTQALVPSLDQWKSLIDSPSVLLVARNAGPQGTIIAAATLGVFRTPSGLHGHIEDVIVDTAWRGQGIGTMLVQRLLLIAKKMGIAGVSLTCNPRREAANALYQKMGFKKWNTNLYWYEL